MTSAEEFAELSMKKNRIFEWLTSTSARILGSNIPLTLFYLRTRGKYLTTADAVAHIMDLELERNAWGN